ncbi:MAG TPA: ECF-type sigma factor [Thermoanaerobaculia bacterium]|nr:ECF-type sigma factor [Thermoanaerobaculia bacterium]
MAPPAEEADAEVTLLLAAWRAGDSGALSRLMPLVYGELRRLAAHFLAAERPNHTLQATALVHEAYLRFASGGGVRLADRAHFFAVAAQVMRRLLVDHARGRAAAKRGGAGGVGGIGGSPIPLTPTLAAAVPGVTPGGSPEELLALDDALGELARLDPRKARAIELRYFAGSTLPETAEVLGVSPATVVLETRLARAWLFRRLRGGTP